MRGILPSILALLLGAALLQLGNGLQFTLIPVRGDAAGFGLLAIGLITVGYFAGFLLGSWLGPRLIGDVGHVRVLLGALAGLAAMVLVYPLAVDGIVWVIARFLSGLALSLSYMSIESWLNERAGFESRGRVLSLYALSGFLMLAVGQVALTLYPASGYEPFSVAAIAVALAALPVAFSRAPLPVQIARPRLRPRALISVSRVAVLGIVAAGLTNSAFWAFAPVYAARAGLETGEIALFMAAALAGAATMIWPVGALSDRTDRRIVIGAVNLGASLAASLVIVTMGQPLPATLCFGFLYGACAFSIYSLCLAHANDRAEGADIVELSGALLILFGASAMVGPLAAAAAMWLAGNAGVFLFTAGVHLLAGAGALYLRRYRAAVKAAAKTAFQPMPRTTAAAYELQQPAASERNPSAG